MYKLIVITENGRSLTTDEQISISAAVSRKDDNADFILAISDKKFLDANSLRDSIDEYSADAIGILYPNPDGELRFSWCRPEDFESFFDAIRLVRFKLSNPSMDTWACLKYYYTVMSPLTA